MPPLVHARERFFPGSTLFCLSVCLSVFLSFFLSFSSLVSLPLSLSLGVNWPRRNRPARSLNRPRNVEFRHSFGGGNAARLFAAFCWRVCPTLFPGGPELLGFSSICVFHTLVLASALL